MWLSDAKRDRMLMHVVVLYELSLLQGKINEAFEKESESEDDIPMDVGDTRSHIQRLEVCISTSLPLLSYFCHY